MVSVVIPSFNCARFLVATIDSVLSQTTQPHEVVIVDDGSTDETPALISKYADCVTYVRQANCGVSRSRNRALEIVTGHWVMFLDADDVLAPQALEMLLSQANGDVVVYGDKTRIAEDGTLIEQVVNRDCTGPVPSAARACFGGAAFEPGCAIVPRKLAQEIGGFDQQYMPCDDRHFWLRCGALVEFRHVPEIVMHYRVRPGSLSKNRPRQVRASVKTRIDILDWFSSRGIAPFDPPPDREELLAADLESVYWAREWPAVDALLALAEEYGIDSLRIQAVRRRRLIPGWLWTLKDRLDDVRSATARSVSGG